jgi:polar amino acid transport system substrate-binding protein
MVVEAGGQVHKFSPGDRVACIGAGYAAHAEYISVPENLVCKIPPNLTWAEASSAMLGIIALHGIRCSQSKAGEIVAVIGLGLLGLLTLQILRAYGFKVIGMDVDPAKIKIARKLGADDVYTAEGEFKNGVDRISSSHGADAVIITASTQSDVPVNTAVDLIRYGGKIVVVGVADIHPQRNEMWHKEVEIIVSKAGGPGIFDPLYENQGIDYPVGYIRWTQNRNLEEYLRLLAEKKVDVNRLISHEFNFENAETVYADMLAGRGGPYTGVVFNYPESSQTPATVNISRRALSLAGSRKRVNGESNNLRVGVIGAGLFGRSLLLPALKTIAGISLNTIATASGANTYHIGKKYGFQEITTDFKEVLANPDIDAVIILTPHSQHAPMVIEALNCEKHVFVEKPLCVNSGELNEIVSAYQVNERNGRLTLQVGYNRRFSPHALRAAELLQNRHDPMVINYRVNAGFVPGDHWVHSAQEGGSRIIGEICHFVDLMQYLCGCDPIRVFAERISANNKTSLNSDNLAVTLKFADGSVGNIVYSASGDKAFSRERVELFWEGKTLVIDDYRRSDYHFNGKKKSYKTINQQMGYKEELQHFCDLARNAINPVLTADESFISTLCVFEINQALEAGQPCEVLLTTS